MKTQLHNLDDLVGKTVHKAIEPPWGNQFVFWFTDDTFAAFAGFKDYDGDIELSILNEPFDMFDFHTQSLIDCGFISLQEVQSQRENEQKAAADKALEWKKDQYNRLKEELGL